MSEARGQAAHTRIEHYAKQNHLTYPVQDPSKLTPRQRKRLRKKINQHSDERM